MKKQLLTLGVIAAFAGLATPCCVTYANIPVQLSNETTVIIWDPGRKRQHFVRLASFASNAKDFGFIVPTPSQPKLSDVDPGAFEPIERYVRKMLEPPPAWDRALKSMPPTAGISRGVDVLDRQIVGDFDAAVLRATDSAALGAWLKENGYNFRPGMRPWVDHYVKRNWVFTALKLTPQSLQQNQMRGLGDNRKFTDPSTGARVTAPIRKTSAIRLSFDTEMPHYPYKMPNDTWPDGHFRPMNLYVFTTGTAQVDFTNGAKWEGIQRWAGPYAENDWKALLRAIKLEEPTLQKPVLTAFVNGKSKAGYQHDLRFVATTYIGPEIKRNMIVGIAVGALAVYGFWRFGRGRARIANPSPSQLS